MNKNKFLQLALEDASAEPADAPSVNEVVVDEIQTDADEVLSAVDAERNVNAAVAEGNELADAVTTLESIYTQMDALASAGLTAQSAEFAQLAMNVASRHANVTTSPIASMETFNRRPVMATQLSMENVGETIKATIKKILEFLAELWNNVKAFFKRMFSDVEALSQHADKLSARAHKISGSPKHKQFKLTKKQATKIATPNGVVPTKELVEMRDVAFLIKQSGSFDRTAQEACKKIADLALEVASKGNKDNLEGYAKEFRKIDLPISQVFTHSEVKGNHTVRVSDTIPGMKRLQLVTSNRNVEIDSPAKAILSNAIYSTVSIKIEQVDGNVPENVEYNVLTPEEIRSACRNSQLILSALSHAKNWGDEMKASHKRLEDYVTRTNSSILEGATVGVAVRFMNKAELVRTQVAVKACQLAVYHARAVLNIAESSIAQYEVVGESAKSEASAASNETGLVAA